MKRFGTVGEWPSIGRLYLTTAGCRRVKRNLAIAASCVLLVAGCSKKEAASTGGASTSTGDASNASKNASSSVGKTKISLWSSTEDTTTLLNDYYIPAHPDIDVEYSFTVYDQYTSKLDPVLASGNGAPDVFAVEDAFVRKYIESGLLLPLDDVYAEVKDKMVPYTMQLASYNGHVYGLSYDVTPGALFYRRSLAKKYLGTDDPVEVQKYLSDEDKFVAAAKTLKEKSGGKCSMIVSNTYLYHPYTMGARKNPWIVDGKLYIDSAMDRYMDVCKLFYDEKYDAGALNNTEAAYAGMQGAFVDDKGNPREIFCYLLPTWGLHAWLKRNCGDTSGDWAMCAGPYHYRWGGTWIVAYKGTEHPAEAKEMIKYMATDDDCLEKYALKTGDVVSNIKVQNKIKGTFSEPFLGGQNHYAQFCEMAKAIDDSMTQATDSSIEPMFGECVTAYILGEKTKEQALASFKAQVAQELGY